ncbi:MAG: sensor histidine kinase N-terminal domain-containing protein [Halothiobacillaceae bacterium]|nr:sensor histidine kinase N-terminal domain-containing protein [Halothiobacillaceae bacterium]
MTSNAPRLRHRLFYRVILPALLLLGVSGLVAHQTAVSLLNRAYDQALRDIAHTLLDNVRLREGELKLDLPPIAQDVLLDDDSDKLYYEVRLETGQHIAGQKDIPDPVRLPLPGGRRYDDGRYLGEPVRYLTQMSEYQGQRLVVQVAETVNKRGEIARDTALMMLLPSAFALLLGFLWLWAGTLRGLAPLDALREAIARRSHADLSPLPLADVPLEVRPLVEEINALLARLDRAWAVQRDFTADAAHQLRTPLAGLQAQMELALSAQTAERRQTHLENAFVAAQRSCRLAEQLLRLARLDDPAQQGERLRVDLALRARERAPEWAARAERQGGEITFDLAPACLKGEADRLDELMDVLVDNALRHALQPGGRIRVATGRKATGEVFFRVDDAGPGIPEDERERVFERFHSRGAAAGAGLGLALARDIALRQAGRLTLSPLDSEAGCRFEFLAPGAPPAA